MANFVMNGQLVAKIWRLMVVRMAVVCHFGFSWFEL